MTQKKINLAELLKDCPSGMELDCASYDNVSFDKISDDKKDTYPIFCYITDKEGNRSGMSFTENGCESKRYGAKCVIFPKGKTTWEGFVPPCKFKDGDIIYNQGIRAVAIFCKQTDKVTISHCFLNGFKELKIKHYHCKLLSDWRLATEKEKQKLFDAIEMNGYKWNAETKTLEKLVIPEFNVGDRIRNRDNGRSSRVVEIKDDYFIIKTLDGFGHSYLTDKLPLSKQVEYELVPNKFDINTLKPFDKVLIRLTNNCAWMPKFFLHYDTDPNVKYYPFVTIDNIGYPQCIPYEGNEHLCRKTDDCDDFYKTWE